MNDDLWFMALIIVGILLCCGSYWAGVAWGKQEGRRIAKDTKHACQLEIERVSRQCNTTLSLPSYTAHLVDLTRTQNERWQSGPASQRKASHDSDAG